MDNEPTPIISNKLAKSLITYAAVLIFSAVVLYLIGAFINGAFDLQQWSEESRIGVAIPCGFTALMSILFVFDS